MACVDASMHSYPWIMAFVDAFMHSSYPWVLVLIIPLSALLVLWTSGKRKSLSLSPPPQPAGAWPLIGHLHLLNSGNTNLHQILGGMADKYGSVFALRLGFHETLVISSWQGARECFTTNDIAFSNRPNSLAMRLMAYNHSLIGLLPYGHYWRSLRRFIVLQLLSNHRLQALSHVRFSEIDLFTKNLYRLWNENQGGKGGSVLGGSVLGGSVSGGSALVNLTDYFKVLTANIITSVIAGKRYAGINTQEARRFQKAFEEFSHLSGLFPISDAIPFLGWLDILNGNCGKMKKVAEDIDGVLSRWVNEHREQRRAIKHTKKEESDLIHVMLSHIEDGDLANNGCLENDDDTIIKSTCMALIFGGNDTTSLTLTWALCCILNNPEVLQKAQQELDTQVGKHRVVEESDMKNLLYLQAILKETMRLQPTAPLLVPRVATSDCKVAGFDIRIGTRLLVNAWKMHRDPSVWSEALRFEPTRFLLENKNINVTGMNFELLPFGAGRRICPGITFSQQVIHLALARLLQAFELETVGGLPVDMTQSPGLTIRKATPLEVLIRPRLSMELIGGGLN